MALLAHLPMLGTLLDAVVARPVRRLGPGVRSSRSAPLQKKMLANVRAGLAGNWDETEYRELSARVGDSGARSRRLAPVVALFLMVMKPA